MHSFIHSFIRSFVRSFIHCLLPIFYVIRLQSRAVCDNKIQNSYGKKELIILKLRKYISYINLSNHKNYVKQRKDNNQKLIDFLNHFSALVIASSAYFQFSTIFESLLLLKISVDCLELV